MPIFDAHFHVIDPRFPLVPNQGFEPEPFTVSDYRSRVDGLEVVGGAVVSGSFQAFDQTYLIDALQQLGPGFVGVANVPLDITDGEVLTLAEAGVRAFRVNLFRGADVAVQELTDDSLKGVDIALFSAGGAQSKRFAPAAVRHGAVVVDNSSAFRMDPNTPLVVPEIKSGALAKHNGIIANPNCVAIVAATPLWPLHQKKRIARITKPLLLRPRHGHVAIRITLPHTLRALPGS